MIQFIREVNQDFNKEAIETVRSVSIYLILPVEYSLSEIGNTLKPLLNRLCECEKPIRNTSRKI